ncbi:HlyD family efflux transporter periplasmic adaptor subunit [bacterium]|nr:MAG: HlyD family efflux transporter periplasmic adaptor subunit [bacterium]
MKKLFLALTLLTVISCSGNNDKSDAYGNFEATEIIISAEAGGKLLRFEAEEGLTLNANAVVGYIDTTQLALKREQLLASQQSIRSKSANILAQIDVVQEQKNVALIEKQRLEKLFEENAATQKQLDDINGQLNVLDKQMASIETQNAAVLSDIRSLDSQIRQINDQIQKSIIINPVKGTILTKFAEPFEVIGFGKPLYKIADLSTMFLRVYVSGDQLPKVKIGEKVEVLIDQNKTENIKLEGEISWISSKAEFTPKIIQTKQERVNMVYAVKVRVTNDGSLKIGMPGEIKFKQPY